MATTHTSAQATPRGHGRRWLLLSLNAASLSMLLALSAPAEAQTVSGSNLYYRLGGGAPGGKANNKNQIALKLGLNLNLRLNYSCGKFDIGMSWKQVMNGFTQLGTQITGAIQAGIAALPLYILQRAQPGLYQLFTDYSAKADVLVAASLKSCEEMERDIKAGKDPYQDWVALAQGEAWRVKASASGDVVQAKLDITKNNHAQRTGVSWVFNNKAGGVGLLPIRPVRDLSVAGYNITLNKPTTALANVDYSASADRNARIVKAFKTPEAMATFTAEVLGDQAIYLCEGETDCPAPTSTATALGLGPKFEAELDFVAPRLAALANAAPGTYAMLAEINAPGIAISPQLMESIRKLPPDIRGVAVDRIANEMALQRVVDKALVARNALLAALSLPEATAAGEVSKDVQVKIDQLSKYINDVMFEFRIRKEMTGESALAIMNDAIVRGSQSQKVRDAVIPETSPVTNGRVLK